MTNHEAFVFGWVYGYLCRKMMKDIESFDTVAPYPFTSNAKIIQEAMNEKVLTKDVDKKIAEALNEIEQIEPDMDGGSEKHQPVQTQGSWMLGYYRGIGGGDFRQAFDIAAKRKAKNMTQSDLAEAMGVDQAVISRWESGQVTPNEENMEKLKELLAR